MFDQVFAELKADNVVAAAEIKAIAEQYSATGRKPSSRAAALSEISKRFVEKVRYVAKNKVAEKARPW